MNRFFFFVLFCTFCLYNCGSNALLYQNGKLLSLSERTPCGSVETQCFVEKKGCLVQIKFTESIPVKKDDKIFITAYKNGIETILKRKDSLNHINDSCYYLFPTDSSVFRVFTPFSDSIRIDLSQVLINNEASCFPSTLTLIPKGK